ncbi:MAG: hypothetical protein KGM47_01865 [Acidobacteriota bacterium]|nr:hypothetical protein [Acidobacteriota bacterium]
MKRRVVLILAFMLLGSGLARAGEVTIGLLSFDQLIPANGSVAGINAFDLYNFTGPTYGPLVGPPYASDSLTFANAKLTVKYELACTTPICPHVIAVFTQSLDLGDIAPGELLDTNGNPIAQFPSTYLFLSSTLTATLSPTTFTLSDGTTFTAAGSITAGITLPSGSFLVAGTDFTAINAEQSSAIPTPEPSTLALLLADLIGLFIFSFLLKRRRLLV